MSCLSLLPSSHWMLPLFTVCDGVQSNWSCHYSVQIWSMGTILHYSYHEMDRRGGGVLGIVFRLVLSLVWDHFCKEFY